MSTLSPAIHTLATAHIVDACMRLNVPYRLLPYDIKPLLPMNAMLSGPVVPVRHYGSVDVFLEALESAPKEGVLVIDNQARVDEACIGDLIVLEVKNAGLKAMIVNGLHRDTKELLQIGLPVFSRGAYPSGPARLDEREQEAFASANVGHFSVTGKDTVFIDQDGAIFIETALIENQLFEVAAAIRDKEKQQVIAAEQGTSLREQFQFEAFLKQRKADPGHTFRKHLAAIAKSIEE